MAANELKTKIRSRQAYVGIIGLGYVGLPLVLRFSRSRYQWDMHSVPLTPYNLSSYDVVVIASDHSSIDYNTVEAHSSLIIDTRNVIQSCNGASKIVRA